MWKKESHMFLNRKKKELNIWSKVKDSKSHNKVLKISRISRFPVGSARPKAEHRLFYADWPIKIYL